MEEKSSTSSEEESEILVYVNFDDLVDDFSKEELACLNILGIDSDEPIFQIGNKAFGGTWNEVLGTALLFEPTTSAPKRCYFSGEVPNPLKYYEKTSKQLNLKRIFISPKLNPTSTEAEPKGTDSSDNDNDEQEAQITDFSDSCDPGSSNEP